MKLGDDAVCETADDVARENAGDAASMSSSDFSRGTAISNAAGEAPPNAGAANMSPCSDEVRETTGNDKHAVPPDAASMAPCSDLARGTGDCAANTPHRGDTAGEGPPNADAVAMAPCGDTADMPPCGAAHVGDHASEADPDEVDPDEAHPDARAVNMAPCSDAASSGHPDAAPSKANIPRGSDNDT